MSGSDITPEILKTMRLTARCANEILEALEEHPISPEELEAYYRNRAPIDEDSAEFFFPE